MQFSTLTVFATTLLAAASSLAAPTGEGRLRARGRPRGKGRGKSCTTVASVSILPPAPTSITNQAPTIVSIESVVETVSETTSAQEFIVVITTTVAPPAPTEAALTTTEQQQSAPAPAPTTTDSPTQAPTPAPAPAPAPATGLSADQQAALDSHNAARRAVGVPDLVWDADLANAAQTWADQLPAIGSLQHSDGSQRSDQGENLYWQSSSGTPFAAGATAWVNEVSSYHGETIGQGDFEAYGHYTQCVWKTTTKVGMAVAKDANGGYYVVARYSPAGNVAGQTPY